jgi:hypothetical protein
LIDFRIFSCSISGKISDEINNIHKLSRLELHDAELTGKLSSRISELTNLVNLGMRRNHFWGTIPIKIAMLDKAILLWLHLNMFEGSVPNEICATFANQLGFLNSDCAPEASPTNPCSYCTNCCDRVTELCLIQGGIIDDFSCLITGN